MWISNLLMISDTVSSFPILVTRYLARLRLPDVAPSDDTDHRPGVSVHVIHYLDTLHVTMIVNYGKCWELLNKR